MIVVLNCGFCMRAPSAACWKHRRQKRRTRGAGPQGRGRPAGSTAARWFSRSALSTSQTMRIPIVRGPMFSRIDSECSGNRACTYAPPFAVKGPFAYRAGDYRYAMRAGHGISTSTSHK
jgi:hypothetical protein